MKVAIIGAGASGLASLKESLDHGFNAVCFEMSDDIGGIWRFRERGSTSVSRKTVSLTSKHMMAFSDFPPPENFPIFLHHKHNFMYLKMYAYNFELLKHIKFETIVVKVTWNENYDKTGRWDVTSKNLKTEIEECETFDGVFVANGRYSEPHVPHLDGIELFQGRVLNSLSYRSTIGFENRSVVVVGLGNTACDAASGLVSVASQVYMSSRKKEHWCSSRIGVFGFPHDMLTETRFFHWLYEHARGMSIAMLEFLTTLKFDRKMTNGSKSSRLLISNKAQVVNDELPIHILSGAVVMVPGIKKFTGPNSIEFQNGSIVNDIDDIILCTGYRSTIPFLKDHLPFDPNFITRENAPYNLMYPIFDNNAKVEHNTLCLIGMVAPRGTVAPISEMQARYHCAVLTGCIAIPDYATMKKKRDQEADKSPELSPLQVRWLPYLDDLAEELGVKPSVYDFIFCDPWFATRFIFSAAVPYQFRLKGLHAWHGAKEAMMESWVRPRQMLSSGRKIVSRMSRRFSSMVTVELGPTVFSQKNITKMIILCVICLFVILYFVSNH